MSRYPLDVAPDPFPSRTTTLRVAARTDRGLERSGNEDRAAFAVLGERRAFDAPASAVLRAPFAGLVCDGMGGEEGGEVASRLAVETILPFLEQAGLGDEGHVARALVASIESASARIQVEGQRRPALARMGTTATLAAVTGRSLVCAQVGDSRAYLFRDGVLTQLTRDQTMAELLRSSGQVPPGMIHELVGKNVILQALGCSTRLDVALTHVLLADGDRILLCSDGLHGVVSDEAITDILAGFDAPEPACDALVRATLRGGAPDNVTCLLLDVVTGR